MHLEHVRPFVEECLSPGISLGLRGGDAEILQRRRCRVLGRGRCRILWRCCGRLAIGLRVRFERSTQDRRRGRVDRWGGNLHRLVTGGLKPHAVDARRQAKLISAIRPRDLGLRPACVYAGRRDQGKSNRGAGGISNRACQCSLSFRLGHQGRGQSNEQTNDNEAMDTTAPAVCCDR